MSFLFLAVLLGAPVAISADNPDATLRVESAWVREAPPVARVLAAYATICNDGARAQTLTNIHSKAFARIEMHISIEAGTSATMQHLDNVVVPPGGCVEFAPGGRHFMLFDPAAALRAGNRVDFRFETAEGIIVNATLPVKRVDEMNKMEHGHHHEH